MEDSGELIKKQVEQRYSQIATQSKTQNENSCCGVGAECGIDFTAFNENYEGLEGYNKNSNLGLGCGIPTKSVKIKKGDVVLDLGSGAGNDCFLAHKLVGPEGKVIGLDMTIEMLKKAWKNLDESKINNIEFRLGDIENMPIADNTVDVIISNCVINLVPKKEKAFSEMFRVLKPGGMFSISDVVVTKVLPPGLLSNAELYCACTGGAIVKEEYLDTIKKCGFGSVEVKKEKEICIPDEFLLHFTSKEEVEELKNNGTKILSITVVGEKPVPVEAPVTTQEPTEEVPKECGKCCCQGKCK